MQYLLPESSSPWPISSEEFVMITSQGVQNMNIFIYFLVIFFGPLYQAHVNRDVVNIILSDFSAFSLVSTIQYGRYKICPQCKIESPIHHVRTHIYIQHCVIHTRREIWWQRPFLKSTKRNGTQKMWPILLLPIIGERMYFFIISLSYTFWILIMLPKIIIQ